MKKIILQILVILVIGCCLMSLSYTAFAETEQTLSFTTYYPAPSGIYQGMKAQRIAVGSNYINADVDTENLVVEGNMGIGTETPSAKLHVNGSAYASGGFSGTSDLRLKKNVEKLTDVLEKIKEIDCVKFDWRADEFPNRNLPQKRQIGLIAQQVEKEFPELVQTDDEGYKTLTYDGFTGVLLEAIKEQQKQIEFLKKEIEELKRK